ncbi:MAG: GNAT family N-acetyltransferase [Oscillospiraceae bacterium]|nr:GNAT family N-acetyltransferase [Oscillospiraceae bacterium]
MIKLQGKNIYLAVLERSDCKKLYEDFEYDFDNPAEPLYIGQSVEKSDEWFYDIQKLQGNENVRLGIFLNDGTVIGDVALQSIDNKNRSCSIGMGMAKIENRNKGYGKEAVKLILDYGFNNLGMERITANTLEINISAQKSLEKSGFVLEGRERKVVYFGGKRYDRLNYGLLADEYLVGGKSKYMNNFYMLNKNLRHIRIDPEKDKDYIRECHCRVNYECDTPYARKTPYEEYRANWCANAGQQEGFLSPLIESMKDERTIAEIIKTESGETVAYFWVSFHGEDTTFIWADVQDIYIEESYRKSGIATYLMDYAEKSARQNGAKVIRSGTGCENIKSQGLHKKLGYYQYRFEYEKVLN